MKLYTKNIGRPENIVTSEELSQRQIEQCYDNLRGQVFKSIPFENAEDVVQDVWLRALDNLCKFRGESSFSSWVYSIARGTIANYHREGTELWRAYAWIGSGEPESAVVMPDQDSMLVFDDLVSKAEEKGRGLEGTNLKPRSILRDRFLNGYTHREIAEKWGVTRNSIERQYRRRLKRLRSVLGGR